MREREVFIEALQLSAAERSEWLAESCASDGDLRRRVEKLLAAHEMKGEFVLDAPPPGLERPESTFEPNEALGQMVGRYRLLSHIGEGGFGDVYRAEQQDALKREVAVKVIKPGMDSRLVIARFEAEQQAMALMNHPHVAKVLDAGTSESGRPYFVMELVDGIPINEYCDLNQLSVTSRLGIFLHVCRAVHHAHQKGVIHRDIKPSNVLVCETEGQPVPKVIDFGVAKAIGRRLTEKTVFTEHGQLVGTLEYMSPEQATYGGSDVDTRSDVFSLGVLLYELVVGATPFSTEYLTNRRYDEIPRVIAENDAPTPSKRLNSLDVKTQEICENRNSRVVDLKRTLKGDLSWVIMKAIEKDRSRRYPSVDTFIVDIQRYLSGETVAARAPSRFYQVQKLVSRHRGLFLALTGFISILLISTLISVSLYFRSEKQRQQAEENLEISRRLVMRTLAPAVDETLWRSHTQQLSQVLIDDAISEFSKMVAPSSKPSHRLDLVNLHLIRARNNWILGNDMLQDCEIAISTLETMVVSNKKDAAIRTALSQAYRLLGHHYCQTLLYNSAVTAYAKSCQFSLVAELTDVDGFHSFALRKIGKLSDADVQSANALRDSELSTDSLQLREHRAWILLEMGRLNSAKRVLADARSIIDQVYQDTSNKNSDTFEYWDGILHTVEASIDNCAQEFESGRKHSSEAIRAFEELRRKMPGMVWASRSLSRSKILLSDSLVAMNQWSESQSELRSAIEFFNKNGQRRDLDWEASAHFRLAQILAATGQTNDAERHLKISLEQSEKLYAISVDEPLCKRELLTLLLLSPLREFRDAKRALSISEEIAPETDPLLWQFVGLANYRNGKWSKAIQSMKMARSHCAEPPLTGRLVTAMAKWHLGDTDHARSEFEDAVESINSGKPILFTTYWGPLTIRNLQKEAQQLISSQSIDSVNEP